MLVRFGCLISELLIVRNHLNIEKLGMVFLLSMKKTCASVCNIYLDY